MFVSSSVDVRKRKMIHDLTPTVTLFQKHLAPPFCFLFLPSQRLRGNNPAWEQHHGNTSHKHGGCCCVHLKTNCLLRNFVAITVISPIFLSSSHLERVSSTSILELTIILVCRCKDQKRDKHGGLFVCYNHGTQSKKVSRSGGFILFFGRRKFYNVRRTRR